MNDLKQCLDTIMQAAIAAVHPAQLIRENIRLEKNTLMVGAERYALEAVGRLIVIGMGKASAAMAKALEEILGDRISEGMVITKYGHALACQHITIREAGHPFPDENSLRATAALRLLVEGLDETDLVICLISGGGSALLEQLPDEVSLADLQQTSRVLLACGAGIEEINLVRKHLSLVKGGQLGRAMAPARCLNLLISDVIGDSLATIASGPTVVDPSTIDDAWHVVDTYRLADRLPRSVIRYLDTRRAGAAVETGLPATDAFKKMTYLILGNNRVALQAAAGTAQMLGFQPLILTSRITGEAREAARVIAAIAMDILEADCPVKKPACLLFGGETTVNLLGSGKGGRNQEFALATLLAMPRSAGRYLIASVGTDGSDGPTDATGAFASPEIWRAADAKGLDPAIYLANNDAYPFFEACDGLIKTGPTGTNVMDIGVVLLPAGDG